MLQFETEKDNAINTYKTLLNKSTIDTVRINGIDDDTAKTPLTAQGVKEALGKDNDRITVTEASNGDIGVITPAGHFVINKSGNILLTQAEINQMVKDNASSFNSQDEIDEFKKNPLSKLSHIAQRAGTNGLVVDTISIIKGLSNNEIATSELRHEVFHIAEYIAFNAKQRRMIRDAFEKRAKQEGISVSEAAANAFANWNLDNTQQKGVIKALFKKAKDLLVHAGMIKANGNEQLEQLVRDFRSGKVFENYVGDRTTDGTNALIKRTVASDDILQQLKDVDTETDVKSLVELRGKFANSEAVNETRELLDYFNSLDKKDAKTENIIRKLTDFSKQTKIENKNVIDAINARIDKLQSISGNTDSVIQETANDTKKLVGKKILEARKVVTTEQIFNDKDLKDFKAMKSKPAIAQERLNRAPQLLAIHAMHEMQNLSRLVTVNEILNKYDNVADLQKNAPHIANQLRVRFTSQILAASNDFNINIKDAFPFLKITKKTTVNEIVNQLIDLGLQKDSSGKSFYSQFDKVARYSHISDSAEANVKQLSGAYTNIDKNFINSIGSKYSSSAELVSIHDIGLTPNMVFGNDSARSISTLKALALLYRDLNLNEIKYNQFMRNNGINENFGWCTEKFNGIRGLFNLITNTKEFNKNIKQKLDGKSLVEYLADNHNDTSLDSYINQALDEALFNKDGYLRRSVYNNIMHHVAQPVTQRYGRGGKFITMDIAYDTGMTDSNGERILLALTQSDYAYKQWKEVYYQEIQRNRSGNMPSKIFDDTRRKGIANVKEVNESTQRIDTEMLFVLPSPSNNDAQLGQDCKMLKASLETTVEDLQTMQAFNQQLGVLETEINKELEKMTKTRVQPSAEDLALEYSKLGDILDTFQRTYYNTSNDVDMAIEQFDALSEEEQNKAIQQKINRNKFPFEEFQSLPKEVHQKIIKMQRFADNLTDKFTRTKNPMSDIVFRNAYKKLTELSLAKKMLRQHMLEGNKIDDKTLQKIKSKAHKYMKGDGFIHKLQLQS